MIIELCLDAIYAIFEILTKPIAIPMLPDDFKQYMTTFFEVISDGGKILSNYVPYGYLMVLFALNLVFDTGVWLYRCVMWILRKIPLLGIK